MADDESQFVPPEEVVPKPEDAEQVGQTPETAVGQPQTPEQTQADFVLTPEIEARIMEKVQDINEKETCLHATSMNQGREDYPFKLKQLEQILREGLLGNPINRGNSAYTKKDWAQLAKKRKEGFVFFNIIGREIQRVDESFWMRENAIAIIFDASKFKEMASYDEDSGHNYTRRSGVFRTKTFAAHDLSSRRISIESPRGSRKFKWINTVNSDMGYALTFRVAPRWFRGIVFKVDRDITPEEMNGYWEKTYPRAAVSFEEYKRSLPEQAEEMIKKIKVEDMSTEANQKRAREIALINNSLVKDKSKLIPIYDIHGNMWWPKQMSYEEVKKFVAEREAGKKTAPSPGLRPPSPKGGGEKGGDE